MTFTIAGAQAAPGIATVYLGPDVAQANLLSPVPAGVQESVILRVEIDKEGTVTNVAVVSGRPEVSEAALAAVKQRRYRPHLLNGQPTAVVTTVRIGS
jgi:TonB family protein